MLNLTPTIIQRIQIAKTITHEISNILTMHSPISSIDSSSKVNRAISKFLSQIKKKEK